MSGLAGASPFSRSLSLAEEVRGVDGTLDPSLGGMAFEFHGAGIPRP